MPAGNAIQSAYSPNPANWANVKNAAYGATGNGTTDDTAAFAAAVAGAGTGGVIYVPAGTYILSALALNVASQMVRLDPGATLKLKAAANGPAFTITGNGVTVTGGGVIDGNYANQTPGLHPLCVVSAATDVTFDGVTVQNANGYGIAAGTNATNVSGFTVRNCTFTSTYYEAVVVGATSIAADITDVAFTGNKIYNNSSALIGGGLGFAAIGNPGTAYVRRVVVTDNRIELYPIGQAEGGFVDWAAGAHFSGVISGTIAGNAMFGCTLPVTIPDSQNVTVSANVIEGWSGYGIEVPCASSVTSGIEVTGNTLLDTNPRHGAGFDSLYSISLSAAGGATRYVSVSGNTVFQVTSAGYPVIGVGGSSQVLDHISVVGNVLKKTGTGGGAIQAHKIQYLVVSDNEIDCAAVEQNVIWLDSGAGGGTYVARWLVAGNLIANYGSAHTGILYGSGTENMTYVSITGNLFYSAAGAAGVAAASSGVLAAPFLNTNNTGP